MSNTRPEFSRAISGLNKASRMHFNFNSDLWLICCFAELYPETQRASYACALFICLIYQSSLSFSIFHHIQDAACSLLQFAYCPSASSIIDQVNSCFLLVPGEIYLFLQDCVIPQAPAELHFPDRELPCASRSCARHGREHTTGPRVPFQECLEVC